jgi:signal transduction histidine kinase
MAIMEVIDKGEGIAAEHLPKLSEPFYRADSARQRNTGGFGLGLYLCRLIVQAHGGDLTIESELGEGTHITVTLPPHPPHHGG